MPEATEAGQPTSHVSKIYDSMAKTNDADDPAKKGAPAVHANTGRHSEDLNMVKRLGVSGGGAKGMQRLFGKALDPSDTETTDAPLNFGSKKSTGALPDEVRARLLHFKKCISDMEIQAQCKTKQRFPSVAAMKSVPAYKQVEAYCKDYDIGGFSDWVPTVHSRFYFEEYEIPHILADQFDQLPMDSSIMKVPGALGRLEGTQESDDAVFTPQANTQSSYLVESYNNVVHSVVTQDLLQDSAPAIIDKIRYELQMGNARAYERAILDSTPAAETHIDADTDAGAANLFTKTFKGLRSRAFDKETAVAGSTVHDNAGDTLSKDTFSELLKKMKCQGVDKSDLMFILGCTGETDLVTGAIPELFTAFNFGAIASNVTGEVPPVFGIRVVTSEKVREDLEATGKALAAPAGTLTYMLLVQRSRYQTWLRQATRVWAAPSLPSSDTMLMTSKIRHSFGGTPMAAGNPEQNLAMAINIKTV